MPLKTLTKALPALHETLANHPIVNYTDPLWEMLHRLLVAHAPSGGANLLGGIGDDIAVLADRLDLGSHVRPQFGNTGNSVIDLGNGKAAVDIVVVAHMDRPSFRVRSLADGELFPICANRFPPGEYSVTAKAMRFEGGLLTVGAEGTLLSKRINQEDTLHFTVKRGVLTWQDTVLVDVIPTRGPNDVVIGTGLDNCLSVLITLLTAAVLHQMGETLRDRRVLFVFTDQEEAPAQGFFGHGAARLMHILPPPTYGCVVVDGHSIGHPYGPVSGEGVSVGFVSGDGRGSIVPPNYQALAVDLARQLNHVRPATAQINNGYLSRGDDMVLGRWTRILGLTGAPLSDAHTGHETAQLADIQSGVWWLAHFLAAALNLVPELAPRYALGR